MKKAGKFASEAAVLNYTPPEITIKQLRDAVPPHCFKRNTLRSLSHVAVDLTLVITLVYIASFIRDDQILAWPFYWFLQGVFFTGLWVLAHECGHGAFSDYSWLNNTVGFILHSALLVPYFSWKYTHSKHHKGCAHMDRDQVFLPHRQEDFLKQMKTTDSVPFEDDSLVHEMPLVTFLKIFFMTTIGWPAYLIFNASGQRYSKFTSHFLPSSAIFDPEQYFAVVMSNIGFACTIGILTYLGQVFGSMAVFKYYVMPYLMVNFWLVVITYLQHTDPTLPHYSAKEWNFVKGALATVDRDFGILNHFFHHITDTHVAHHLFSTMPFYHAQEATRAIKKVLGKHYHYDPTPWYQALWRSRKTCQFVENDGDVLWYKY